MPVMLVTLLIFHDARFWLKATALVNMLAMFIALPTFHKVIS